MWRVPTRQLSHGQNRVALAQDLQLPTQEGLAMDDDQRSPRTSMWMILIGLAIFLMLWYMDLLPF